MDNQGPQTNDNQEPQADVGNTQVPKNNKSKNIKTIVLAVAVLVAIAGAGVLLKDVLFAGSSISTSDLVDETEEGIAFKRPSQWQKVDDTDAEITYTEDGKSIGEADQALLLSSEPLGINYNDLSSEQRAFFSSQFIQKFATVDSLQDDICKNVSGIETGEVQQDDYSTLITVKATCGELGDRMVQATIKMQIGVKDDGIYIAAVRAINEAWDENGEVLNAILASVRPANQ